MKRKQQNSSSLPLCFYFFVTFSSSSLEILRTMKGECRINFQQWHTKWLKLTLARASEILLHLSFSFFSSFFLRILPNCVWMSPYHCVSWIVKRNIGNFIRAWRKITPTDFFFLSLSPPSRYFLCHYESCSKSQMHFTVRWIFFFLSQNYGTNGMMQFTLEKECNKIYNDSKATFYIALRGQVSCLDVITLDFFSFFVQEKRIWWEKWKLFHCWSFSDYLTLVITIKLNFFLNKWWSGVTCVWYSKSMHVHQIYQMCNDSPSLATWRFIYSDSF